MIRLENKFTGELIEAYPLEAGTRVIDWLAREVPNFEILPHPPISITINGKPTIQKAWRHVMRAGDVIVIHPEPKVAAIPFVLKILATVAINYAITALTSAKIEDNYNPTTPEGSSIYNASAQANRPRLNGIVPELFGKHKYYPDHVTQPYVFYKDNVQYYCAALACGVGAAAVYSVNIGNTAIIENSDGTPWDLYGDFEYNSSDGNYQLDYVTDGAPTDPWSGNNPARLNIYTSSEVGGTSSGAGFDLTAETAPGDWIGPFDATPSGVNSSKIFVDLFFPGGLAKIENNGSLSNRSVTIELNWREKGTATWQVVNFSYTENTLDQLGKTESITLPPYIEVEVRMRRNTVDSTSTSVKDLVQWTGLKAQKNHINSYKNVSTLFVTIKGTNNLASNASNQLNIVIQRRLQDFSGGSWGNVESSSEARLAVLYMVFNAGLDIEENLDLNTLNLLNGYEFNGVFDSDSTLFESLQRVAAVAYCYVTINNGKIAFFKDDVKTTLGQSFSAENTLSIVENGTLFDPDEPDGVRVEYFDASTWSPETVDCLLNDGTTTDTGINPEEVRAFGITDRTQAWRYGMRIRRQRRYLRRAWTVETELEGLNAQVGELVSLPGRDVQTGWVIDYDSASNIITLNHPVDYDSGTAYYIELRQKDGTAEIPQRAYMIDSTHLRTEFTLSFFPTTDGPGDSTLFKFGTYSQIHIPAIVKSIEPLGDTVRLELAAYDTRVYADDNNSPP